jgi:DNA-binding MarR family transcriptional regulator
MRYLNDTAAYVLRYMAEHGILGRNFMVREKLAKACGLNEETFTLAEEELLQAGYITGSKGGMYGTMWLSSIGISAYQSLKNDYLPIDTDAQHILTYLMAHLTEKNLLPVRELLEATGLTVNTFEDSVQQLKETGLVEDITGGFRALKPTLAGRRAVETGFRKEGVRSSSPQITTGPLNPATAVTHTGNTQPYPRTEQPSVQADRLPADENEIKSELVKVVDTLVDEMFPLLSSENKRQYLDIAFQLQQEVKKSVPDPRTLRYLLGGLSFTSDMRGAFDPGDKVFQLVADSGPTIITIATLLQKLIAPNLR